MTLLNRIVLVGLIAAGLVLVAGVLSSNGTLQGLAAYTGWFLCAYSAVAYLVAAGVFASGSNADFWTTLYPVNFALALFAVATFGVHELRDAAFMLATAVGGASLSYVAFKSRLLLKRAAPIAVPLLLLLILVEPTATAWKYVVVTMAAFVLAGALLMRLALKPLMP